MKVSFSRTVDHDALVTSLTVSGRACPISSTGRNQYYRVEKWATASMKPPRIFPMLDNVLESVRANEPGANFIRYLMPAMNDQIFKLQQGVSRPVRCQACGWTRA